MKKFILSLSLVLLLFGLSGCTEQEQQDARNIQQLKQEMQFNLEQYNSLMAKYKETGDKKYFDDAGYYIKKLEELKFQADTYLSEQN